MYSTNGGQDIYGDGIVFFTDGEVVGGLWNPSVTASRRWKVNVPYSTIPDVVVGESDEKVLLAVLRP
jgi:U3 small nucleolar RNA-associated protein 22